MLEPGQQLYFLETDLDTRKAELIRRGITEGEEKETSWGDRLLIVRDPDGYAVSFLVRTQISPANILTLYMRGPSDLEDALRDPSEQELELRHASGEWSIRQIVDHIVDGDDLWTMGIKAALVILGVPTATIGTRVTMRAPNLWIMLGALLIWQWPSFKQTEHMCVRWSSTFQEHESDMSCFAGTLHKKPSNSQWEQC